MGVVPSPSLPVVVGRAGPGGHESWRASPTTLLGVAIWRTNLENRPCISPGQHNKAGPDGEGMSEPAQVCASRRAVPAPDSPALGRVGPALGSMVELALEVWVLVS